MTIGQWNAPVCPALKLSCMDHNFSSCHSAFINNLSVLDYLRKEVVAERTTYCKEVMNFSANDPQENAKLQTQKEVIAPALFWVSILYG